MVSALHPSVQVVKLCRTHRLYSALTYVLTRGLGDYIAPAVELLLALATAPSGATDADADADGSSFETAPAGQRAAGFKLLVYLRCCLRQEQFPPGAGPLPAGKAGLIKAGVLGEWVPCSAVHHVVVVSQGLTAAVAGHTHTKRGHFHLLNITPHILTVAGMLLYATPATMLQLWRSLGGSAASIAPEQLQQALPGVAG